MAVQRPTAAREDSVELTDLDLHLFHEGTHYGLYKKLGAHLGRTKRQSGAYFSVWAPNAERVLVIGDFNQWSESDPLDRVGDSAIWGGWIPNVRESAAYNYRIVSRNKDHRSDKADPFGFFHNTTRADAHTPMASLVWDLEYEWHDDEWMAARADARPTNFDKPVSIYEVHVGSWMRVPEQDNRFLTYREIAPRLVDYVKRMGFTHVEFLPLMEHPFYGSWGYQCTGYFAPTSRYGTPQDLMFLIDELHRAGIGVIFDWVPSHFATDEHGLGFFDGTHLFERGDPKQRFHPVWQSFLFDYARPEVRSFLISSAFFWLEKYHVDALRVDAVASMLHREGGIDFLRQLNTEVYGHFPGVQMIAEESSAWPKVSRPAYDGGLGFGYKWDMGFSHDILKYISRETSQRKRYHNELTFRGLYGFNENFVLPFSHDDVAYGKCSLLSRMPGDLWQKFANLRLALAYMYAQPGKKLLFMGDEFAQPSEWNHEASLDWHVAEFPMHAGVQKLVGHLNGVYRGEAALHQKDSESAGFEWVDCHDAERSTISWVRWDQDYRRVFLCVFNFTPSVFRNFRIGVPRSGFWREVVNTDAREYGGSGQGNFGGLESNPFGCNDRPHSLVITMPPLAGVFFKCEGSSR